MKKSNFIYFLILIISINLAACGKKENAGMEAQQKSTAIKTFQIFDNGNVDELDGLVSIDVVDHQMDTSVTKKKGIAGVKEMFSFYHSVFPDMKTTINSMAVSGDTIFAYTSSTGTPAKPFMGLPLNQKTTMTGIDVFRFDGDRIVEHWGFLDAADVMKMMQKQLMPDNAMMDRGNK